MTASRGQADLQYNFSELRKYDLGVRQNKKESEKWYKLAVMRHEKADI
jgi:TPR repeat protein